MYLNGFIWILCTKYTDSSVPSKLSKIYRLFIWIASKMTDHNSIIWSCLASRDNGLHRRKTYILIYKKG